MNAQELAVFLPPYILPCILPTDGTAYCAAHGTSSSETETTSSLSLVSVALKKLRSHHAAIL